jgi:hypothetical protein
MLLPLCFCRSLGERFSPPFDSQPASAPFNSRAPSLAFEVQSRVTRDGRYSRRARCPVPPIFLLEREITIVPTASDGAGLYPRSDNFTACRRAAAEPRATTKPRASLGTVSRSSRVSERNVIIPHLDIGQSRKEASENGHLTTVRLAYLPIVNNRTDSRARLESARASIYRARYRGGSRQNDSRTLVPYKYQREGTRILHSAPHSTRTPAASD